MANTSTIHIKTDFDCKVYDYGQELGTTKADTYFNIELRKGEHELTFVFVENDIISKTIRYEVNDVDCDFRLIVGIAETISERAKQLFDSKDNSAFSLLLIAAEHGDATAQRNLGYSYWQSLYTEKDTNKALQWYTKAAEQGDADAQYHLGYFYEHGECIERDHTKAVEWYTKAAEQGHKTAQWILGCCYKYGDGVEKNYDMAVKWFSKAAEQGDAKEQNKLGDCYYYGDGVNEDLSKAVEWYTKAAKQGLAEAQFNLGYCYYWREGVWSCESGDSFCEEMDLMKVKAVEWFTKAGEQGFARAQYWLGLCYQDGTGVEKDLSKAAEWFTKAAEQGIVEAQCKLGAMYYDGQGVGQDYAEAAKWYCKAAEQGDVEAQREIGEMYYTGRGERQDYDEAMKWFSKAAEQGDARSQDALGDMYVSGQSGVQDIIEAEKWWCMASKQGDTFVPFYFGVSSWVGRNEMNAKQVGAEAIKWYCKAANMGSIYAQYKLGEMYDSGWGVETDEVAATHWYRMAAEQGNVDAQRILGIKYEEGWGVEQDYAEAELWYRKAAAQGDSDAQHCLDSLYRNGKCMKPDNVKEARLPKTYVSLDDQRKNKEPHFLVFDTETAGLPEYYNALTHWLSNWPRLVQLSWITTDEECNILSQNDFIIYPDGFTIPEEAVRLHGITTEIAKEKGKPLKEVIDKFMEDFNATKTIVGHNIAFDKKIIGAELIRLGQKDIMDSKKSLCTMEASTDYCRIPGRHGYKWPKLQELHKKLFGYEFEDAHNSMSDVTATLKCFKEMRERGLFGWQVKNSRNFTAEEIASVERNEVVASQYGKSVCFYMVDGGQTFIPLSDTSSVEVGESIDLNKAKIITKCKFGEDDILKVEG